MNTRSSNKEKRSLADILLIRLQNETLGFNKHLILGTVLEVQRVIDAKSKKVVALNVDFRDNISHEIYYEFDNISPCDCAHIELELSNILGWAKRYCSCVYDVKTNEQKVVLKLIGDKFVRNQSESSVYTLPKQDKDLDECNIKLFTKFA